MEVEDCVRAEENNLEIYMKKSEEGLIIAAKEGRRGGGGASQLNNPMKIFRA